MSRTRTRRVAWTLVAAAILVAALYVPAFFGVTGVRLAPKDAAVVGFGVIGVISNTRAFDRPHSPGAGTVFFERSYESTYWWVLWKTGRADSIVAVPIWMPTLVLLIPGLYLLYRIRRVAR